MRIINNITNLYVYVFNKLCLYKNRVNCGENVNIHGRIKYRGKKGNLSIGENTTINSGLYDIPIGYPVRCSFWIMGNGSINIGKSCGISNVSICSMEKVTIEDHVMLGAGVKIYDTDFHSLDYKIRRNIDTDNDRRSREVLIESDAFVGAGTTILKGVTIGKRSVVGAGSVVREDVPDDEIWAGNPAVFIKKCKIYNKESKNDDKK